MFLSLRKDDRITAYGLITLIAVIAWALAGCTKVNPQPFQTFSESLRTLSTGVEAQAETDYQAAREEFEQNVLSAPSAQVLELQLTFPQGDPSDSSTTGTSRRSTFNSTGFAGRSRISTSPWATMPACWLRSPATRQ